MMQRGVFAGLVATLVVVSSLRAHGVENTVIDYGKYVYGNQDQGLQIKSGPYSRGTTVEKSEPWKANEQLKKPLLVDVTRTYNPSGDASKTVTQYVQVFESVGGNPGEIVQYRKLGGKNVVEEFSHLQVGQDWKISAATKCRSSDVKICASVNITLCNDLKTKLGLATMDQLAEVANKCGAVNSAVEGLWKSTSPDIVYGLDAETEGANLRFEKLVDQKNLGTAKYSIKDMLGKGGLAAAHKTAAVEQQNLMLRACAENFSDSVKDSSANAVKVSSPQKSSGARK